MSADENQINLQKFARHIPRTLAQQMLAYSIKQFMTDKQEVNVSEVPTMLTDNSCEPSISRFYGALLFVDISGFTVLSQRLPVDELRVHINAYFKKLLDIIYNYGGDVIKFAGDALYAVWRRNAKQDARQALIRAAKCGVEINATCSNYRINFSVRDRDASQVSDILLNEERKGPTLPPHQNSGQEPDHAFLNVHAGLAVGPMAGLGVGVLDRWEFLIIGPPLKDVALAESEANQGELVISPIAHAVLCAHQAVPEESSPVFSHSHSETNPAYVKSVEGGLMGCGCFRTPGGAFRLNLQAIASDKVNIDPDQLEEDKDDEDIQFELQAMILEDASEGFFYAKDNIMEMYTGQKDRSGASMSSANRNLSPRSGKYGNVNDDEGEIIFNYFLHWIESCMCDDLWRHVHEAVRGDYAAQNPNRRECLYACNKNVEAYTRSRRSSGGDDRTSRRSSNSSEGGGYVSKVKSLAGRNSLREKHRARHDKTLQKDSNLVGELRNVLVMFISIKSETPELLFEVKQEEVAPQFQECALKGFSFINVTPSERQADAKLLSHYQTCMDIIVRALKHKGGQLRQFIVDDKGTVCIGTFGLRGSVNHDNAAAAIEAAQAIIGDLREHDIEVGIGITSGKAYCGLVGSLRRHEYAVMGPSVNLSARLMASAKPGQVICDMSTRMADRFHQYRALGDVKAKGYAEPVPTFRPIFMRGSVLSVDNAPFHKQQSQTSQGSPRDSAPSISRQITTDHDTADNNHVLQKLTRDHIVLGRDKIAEDFVGFLFSPLLSTNADSEPSIETKLDTCILDQMQSSEVLLSFEIPTRMSILEGPSGIGKSSILNLFIANIEKPVKLHHVNAIVIRASTNSFHNIDPFKSLKSVIRKVLTHFAAISKNEEVENEDDGVIKTHISHNVTNMVARWKSGLDYVSKYLSDELKSYLPLLSSAHIIPNIAPNSTTEGLSGADRLTKLQALILEIILCLPKIASKLVFLVCDDAHFLDSASSKLLQELWEKGRGFAVLLTFSGKVEDHETSPLRIIASDAAIDSPPDSVKSRLWRKELPPLPFEAVKGLVLHVFREAGFEIDDETLYTNMEEISGGNPLYIYELSKAMIEKYNITHQAPHNNDHESILPKRNSVLNKSDIGKLLNEFHTARVEEVIFYRFDKLPSMSQVLLKMASIACASGSHGFTLAMLESMLSNDDTDSNVVDVFESGIEISNNKSIKQTLASELRKVLMKDEFLRIDFSRRRSSVSDSQKEEIVNDVATALQNLTVSSINDEVMWNDLDYETFHFKIVLERKTIYDLMLEDQRESLHDRVASFLERENQEKADDRTLTAHDLYEEGFHWEKATIWGSAMSCYFRSAMLLDQLGAYQESFQRLTSAYRMLNALRKDAGLSENIHRPYSMDAIVSFFQNNSRNEILDKSNIEKVFGITVQDISKTFGGDYSLLQTGIDVCLRLAQASFTLSDNIGITTNLYEDAVMMIMLTWGDNSLRGGDPNNHDFYLHDCQVIYPILSGVATLYRTNRLQDDEIHSKEASSYELIMYFAEKMPEHALHRIQGMCLLHSLYFERLEQDKCSALVAQLKQIYKTEKHSAELVKWYGNDRVPFTFAKNIMIMKLRGCIVSSNKDIEELFKLIPGLTHLHSVGCVTLPLSSILVAVKREVEGEKLFSAYYEMEQSRGGYSFFRDSNPIFIEFFRMYSSWFCDSISSPEELTELQKRILNKEFIPLKRPLLYDAVSSMAICVESLCSMILEIQAKTWIRWAQKNMSGKMSQKQSLYEQAHMALEVSAQYAEVAVETSAKANRLIFAYFLALVSKAKVSYALAQIKAKIIADEDIAVTESAKYKKIAHDTLILLAKVGLEQKFPFLVLEAAQLMEDFGFEQDMRTAWQEGSIRTIIAGNDPNKRDVVYQELVRIFPSTSRFTHIFDLI